MLPFCPHAPEACPQLSLHELKGETEQNQLFFFLYIFCLGLWLLAVLCNGRVGSCWCWPEPSVGAKVVLELQLCLSWMSLLQQDLSSWCSPACFYGWGGTRKADERDLSGMG